MEDRETALRRIAEARATSRQTLDLAALGLRAVPEELSTLTNLRDLDLSSNELAVVPDWIGGLTGLRTLDLRDNRLVELPWQVSRLALEALHLDGNPHLLLPPPETVSQGTPAVLACLRDSGPQHEEPVPAVVGPPSRTAELLAADLSVDALSATEPAEAPSSRATQRLIAIGSAGALLSIALVAAALSAGGGTDHAAQAAAPVQPDTRSAAQSSPDDSATGLVELPTFPSSSDPAPSAPSATTPSLFPSVSPTLPSRPTTPSASGPQVVSRTTQPSAAVATVAKPSTSPHPPTKTTSSAPKNPTGEVIGYGDLCMDDASASTADFNPVDLYGCNGSKAQQWTWYPSSRTFRVLGRCLDVYAAGTDNGTAVDIYTCNGTGAQVWVPRSDGTLYNPESGKCLDDTDWRTDWGVQLQIWDCSTHANQKWRIP